LVVVEVLTVRAVERQRAIARIRGRARRHANMPNGKRGEPFFAKEADVAGVEAAGRL
jgi:hypothetical protein